MYAWTNHICARRAERALHPVGTECWQNKLQSRHHRTHTSDNYMHRAGVARTERGSNRGPHSDGLRRADDILQRRDPVRGGDASTFTYAKPEFRCPTRSQISDAFSSAEGMTPNKWSETVRALSALCTQKPHSHTKASEGEKSLCLFCYNNDKISPADRFHPFFSLGTVRGQLWTQADWGWPAIPCHA